MYNRYIILMLFVLISLMITINDIYDADISPILNESIYLIIFLLMTALFLPKRIFDSK